MLRHVEWSGNKDPWLARLMTCNQLLGCWHRRDYFKLTQNKETMITSSHKLSQLLTNPLNNRAALHPYAASKCLLQVFDFNHNIVTSGFNLLHNTHYALVKVNRPLHPHPRHMWGLGMI